LGLTRGAVSRFTPVPKWAASKRYGDVWTCALIAQLIAKTYDVSYHPDYVGPLLRQVGWSVPRPIVRAMQCDEMVLAQ
jgi:transposase